MKKSKSNTVNLFSAGMRALASDVVGTVFYKQIARFEKWVDPYDPTEQMILDKAWAEKIVKNFNAGVIDKVPVPLDHTDQVDRNAGELIKLEIKEDGLYGYLDIRRTETLADIENGTIFDVSICFDWDYMDTLKGDKHGPTLLHVALVNNPYLKGMSGFEKTGEESKFSEALKGLATALAGGKANGVIMLSEAKVKELNKANMEEVKKITNTKDYPVTITVTTEDDSVEKVLEAGEEVEVPADQAEAIEKFIEESEAPEGDEEDEDKDEDGEDKDSDGDDKDGEGDEDKDEDLSETEKEELSRLRKEKLSNDVNNSYTTLLSEGKITPAQEENYKAAMVALAETAGSKKVSLSRDGKKEEISLSELFNQVLQAGPKVVKFSEEGKSGDGDDNDSDEDKAPADLLSEAELKGLEATGVSREEYNRQAKEDPELFKKTEEEIKSKE